MNMLMPSHLLAQRFWKRLLPIAGAGYVLTLGVAPEARKCGVTGGGLLSIAERWMARAALAHVFVDTTERNVRAVDFYHRMGYSDVDRRWGQLLLAKTIVENAPHPPK